MRKGHLHAVQSYPPKEPERKAGQNREGGNEQKEKLASVILPSNCGVCGIKLGGLFYSRIGANKEAERNVAREGRCNKIYYEADFHERSSRFPDTSLQRPRKVK